MSTEYTLREQVAQEFIWGGTWLGACRRFLQRRHRLGSHITWGSEEQLTVSAKFLEDLAYEVALEVLVEERSKGAKDDAKV